MAALLAANSFLIAIPMAALLAWIIVAGNSLQIAGASPSLVFLVTGVMILFAACANVIGRVGLRRVSPVEVPAGAVPESPPSLKRDPRPGDEAP